MEGGKGCRVCGFRGYGVGLQDCRKGLDSTEFRARLLVFEGSRDFGGFLS